MSNIADSIKLLSEYYFHKKTVVQLSEEGAILEFEVNFGPRRFFAHPAYTTTHCYIREEPCANNIVTEVLGFIAIQYLRKRPKNAQSRNNFG